MNLWQALLISFLIGGPAAASDTTQSVTELFHLRLIDRLDRPQDGYCFDILGVGTNLRVDLPLFAHNCKLALTNDSAVRYLPGGQIEFPAVQGCVTIAGVNSRALPGASVLVRRCNERGAFFEASALQRFDLRDDGRLMLADSDLCVVVGTRSDSTYSSRDRWRALFVEDCDRVEAARSRWEFIVPGLD